LISPELAESLAELQDAVPCFSNEEAFQIFYDEFGKRVEDVYELITPNPIAAASLG
jgi:predicted unusual protein kinase regulating ubiquinone biosynthesis (AarF/ABC1/UbiB family)